jgi:hypothetical protein
MWIQDNAAPLHVRRVVINYVKAKYQEKWTRKGGSHAWPVRLADFSLVDSYKVLYEVLDEPYCQARRNATVVTVHK